jgi:hypothetical protein
MTTFLGHSYPVPKYELSSRPERSEVEGPAVLSTSIRSTLRHCPPLCHPERSREPALSEVEWGSAVLQARPGNVFFDKVLMQVEVEVCRAYGAPTARRGARTMLGNRCPSPAGLG